jgi:hypothetical protein
MKHSCNTHETTLHETASFAYPFRAKARFCRVPPLTHGLKAAVIERSCLYQANLNAAVSERSCLNLSHTPALPVVVKKCKLQTAKCKMQNAN